MRRRAPLLAIVFALLTGACGSNTTTPPKTLSFETDIKPITVANCTRCHGAGGELNSDRTFGEYGTPPNGFFDQYEDPPDCVVAFDTMGVAHACRGAGCPAADESTVYVCRGFKYYTMPAGSPVLQLYVPLMMPPQPAPKLSEAEVDLFKRFAAAPMP